jgi:predicted transcriptional regulator
MDQRILEQRLLTKDSAFGVVSVTKCAAKLQQVKQVPFEKNEVENFMKEILLLKLDTDRSWKVSDVLTEQSKEYDLLEQEILRKIAVAKQNTTNLNEDLSRQVDISVHRSACEHIGVLVNQLPSKSSLKRKIDAIDEDTRQTESMIATLNSEIQWRYGQFKILSDAILALQTAKQEDKSLFSDFVDAETEAAVEEESSDQRKGRHNEEEELITGDEVVDNMDEEIGGEDCKRGDFPMAIDECDGEDGGTTVVAPDVDLTD